MLEMWKAQNRARKETWCNEEFHLVNQSVQRRGLALKATFITSFHITHMTAKMSSTRSCPYLNQLTFPSLKELRDRLGKNPITVKHLRMEYHSWLANLQLRKRWAIDSASWRHMEQPFTMIRPKWWRLSIGRVLPQRVIHPKAKTLGEPLYAKGSLSKNRM